MTKEAVMNKAKAATVGVADFREEMAARVSELIGFKLDKASIHSITEDGSGYYFYIQALKPNYPLLAMHYRGLLMLVLPFEDYRHLKDGELTVQEYIDGAFWNYGYYWGGGSLINGAYWQPLEDGTGIHDTARISRYLHILSCRTIFKASGYMPNPERCAACALDEASCSFSPRNQLGSQEDEIQELDRRVDLFLAVNARLRAELGFESKGFNVHSFAKNEIWVLPGFEPYSVRPYLNRELLNDLLYHPGVEHDFVQMAQDFDIILSRPYHPNEGVILPKNHPDATTFCLNYWGDAMLRETSASAIKKAVQSPSVFRAFVSWFKDGVSGRKANRR